MRNSSLRSFSEADKTRLIDPLVRIFFLQSPPFIPPHAGEKERSEQGGVGFLKIMNHEGAKTQSFL